MAEETMGFDKNSLRLNSIEHLPGWVLSPNPSCFVHREREPVDLTLLGALISVSASMSGGASRRDLQRQQPCCSTFEALFLPLPSRPSPHAVLLD
jgi:hypothetical protein